VDLGAGFGLHALPLAELGYSVTAVDRCKPLLQELGRLAQDEQIVVVDADLAEFGAHLSRQADVILCMGDTLTHLPSRDAVRQLCSQIDAHLAPAGRFVATFRDYCGRPPAGAERFIAVRSTPTQILTCFLEYTADHVQVHDLLHQLVDGAWRLTVSSYPKLRLDPDWLVAQLLELGLDVQRDVAPTGMIRVIAKRTREAARKPAA
jgi:SAM-dependent methyltransferase